MEMLNVATNVIHHLFNLCSLLLRQSNGSKGLKVNCCFVHTHRHTGLLNKLDKCRLSFANGGSKRVGIAKENTKGCM